MKDLATAFSKKLPRDYRPGFYRLANGFSSAVGFARDYIYANYGTFAYDIETGGVTAEGVSIIRPTLSQLNILKAKHLAAMLEFLRYSRAHTFRGRILSSDGIPQKDAKIMFTNRHSPYQSAIHTNSDGYFFRYLGDEDLPFTVNLQHRMLLHKGAKTANFILPETAQPVFEPVQSLLYSHIPETTNAPVIHNRKTKTRLQRDLFANLHWIDSRQQVVEKDSVRWSAPELKQIFSGKIRWMLIQNKRLLAQKEQEIQIVRKGQPVVSWCQDISQVNHFWLHRGVEAGTKFLWTDTQPENTKVQGIRLHGILDNSLLQVRVRNWQTGATLFFKQIKADGKNRTIEVAVPAVAMPSQMLVTVENLSSQPWQMDKETSLYPVSGNNMVHYDEWQNLPGADLGIELVLSP
jgi:hypothetical protein